MIAAFADELDHQWLKARLDAEDSYDAYKALKSLGESGKVIDERQLASLVTELNRP